MMLPQAGAAPSARTPWTSHVMRIAAIRDEAPGVQTYAVVFRDGEVGGDGYRFEPGQFNMLLLPGIGEAAISISSAADVDPSAGPDAGTDSRRAGGRGRSPVIEHTVRAVGNVTQALARLGQGAEVILRGPFGKPWPLEALRGRDVVIAAGGVGLASLRAAILRLVARRDDYAAITILHGAKTPADLLYTGEFAAWRTAGITVHTIVDAAGPDWTGHRGLVTDLLDPLDMAAGSTSLLCCGPEAMMAAVVRRAKSRGLADADIYLSVERNMACAAGFCGLCQFGPAFVCKDGPVFRHDVIAPFLAVANL